MKRTLIIFIIYHLLIYFNYLFSGFIFDYFYQGIFSTIFLYSFVNLFITLFFLGYIVVLFVKRRSVGGLKFLLLYLIFMGLLFFYVII